MPRPKKVVSTMKFQTVKKRRQSGPSAATDCTSRNRHQVKMTQRTPSSAAAGTWWDEVAEAASVVGTLRKSRHCARRLYHTKWPAPSASCARMMPKVAGRAQSVCSHGGGGGGGGGDGGGGGGGGEGGGGGLGDGGGGGGSGEGGGGNGDGGGGGGGLGEGGGGGGGGGGGDGGAAVGFQMKRSRRTSAME